MTDESKKIQTTYTGHLAPDPYRIVKEQREVIEKMAQRAQLCIESFQVHTKWDDQPLPVEFRVLQDAICAATPYIQD